ncbi:MAG: ethylbenzene dehydrogenase-related protein [Deltaproteobacteria bacterium]|nr:ethylbenzene dehydrogenase-related protein [Deltaproteobacteria bacterium]
MKGWMVISLMLALALVLGGMLLGTDGLEAAAKQTLTAKRVKEAPSGLDDSVWQKAKAVQVPFEGKEKFEGKKASVTTKAVYTNDGIYFLFKWDDPTLSVTKGAWKNDGQKWTHIKSNEDRISLLFEINRINNFATKGCTVVCHVPKGAPNAKDGKFGTSSAAEKGDLWHWKAARSDPAGVADDTWVTVISEKKGGRKGDAGSGGDKKNITADKSKPMYMLAPGKKLGKNGILLAADAVEITDYSVFKPGDVLTYRMPKNAQGSRGDIKAVSRHADGGWTVMLHRKLDTGNDDDVAFNPRKKYSFAMALFDNSGDEDSYDSEILTLQFKK